MNNRPVLQIPLHPYERILDVAAILFAVVALLVAYTGYTGLPDQIPTHFNGGGVADGFGPKNRIFFLPGLALVMALGLIFLTKFPQHFNFPTKITPENAETEYKKGRFLIRTLNALTALMFLTLTWDAVQIAAGETHQLSILFWIVFVLLLALPLVLLTMWPKLRL